MDTEKYIELEHKVSHGKSPNDEGPYYHHAFWESYKGGVKGKLFGVIVGGLVGTLIGGAVLVVAAIPALGLGALLSGAVPLGIMAAFAGTGLAYGMKEFGDVGRVTGGSAAQFYQHELREKTFIKGQVAELKEEIGEVKSLLKGEPVQHDPKCQKEIAMAKDEETSYRKSHYASLKSSKINSLAFWKVLAVGLVIGAAAGALLAIGGTSSLAAEILVHILGHDVVMGGATTAAMSSTAITAASMATLGAMGASFGINRDFFRKIADKTDLLFKGRFGKRDHDIVRETQIDAGMAIEKRLNGKSKEVEAPISTLTENSGIEYPKSETHFRDKVLPAAQRALLSFDHTRATPQ